MGMFAREIPGRMSGRTVTGGIVRSLPPHGTYTRYHNHGCRCDECRRANTDYYNARNHRLGLHKPWAVYVAERRAIPPPHGTAARYDSRYAPCRCDECRAASAAARRARRHKNLEATRAYDRARRRKGGDA